MAESSRNFNFPNLPQTYWTPSEYDKEVLKSSSMYKHCAVCKIELNSREQYEEHFKGQKHLSRVKSQQILVDDPSKSNMNNNMPRMYNDERRGVSLDVYDDESLGDDTSKHYCKVCNIPFTSSAHRNDHYRGRKHAVALNRMKMKDIPLFCVDCDVQFSSEISAKTHFDSVKHKKKVARGNNNSIFPIEGNDNTEWKHCNICNVSLNSTQQLTIHRNSPRHINKQKELQLSSTSNRRSSLMMPMCRIKEPPLSDEDETRRGPSKQTESKDFSTNGISTPKTENTEPIFAKKGLSPNITAAEAANQNSKDNDSNKIFNNFENPCNIKSSFNSSGSSGLQSDDTFQKYACAKSDSVDEIGNPSYSSGSSPSNLPNETILKMINVTTDPTTMKKVPNNSMQSNNNPTDVITKSQNNSPTTRTNSNNLSLPEETTRSNSPNSETMTQDTISKEEIANIIDGVKNLSLIDSPISENECIGNGRNIPNKTILKAKPPSATSTGRRSQPSKTTSSTSPSETDDDGIPYSQRRWIEKIDRNGKILCYFCILCESQLNQGAVKNHVEGSNHRQKMMTLPVPERDLPPVEQTCEDPTDEAFNLTTFFPRGYQVELFEKCHSTDSIIFLPTGTGKTLCASMLIAYMLKKNPMRSVLFLVDKVLLVFQQKKFIEEQLKGKFLRFDFEDNDKLVERELNIACVCGGTVGTQDKPLWMHDIVLSTAAYCSNMMNRNVLHWSDFSFVVVDEAHHCVKNHPFKKIFSKEHTSLEKSKRPKILGLTASPAGQETLAGTVRMLASLTSDMGGAQIAIVESTADELKKFKSSAKLEIEILPTSDEEMSFNFHLQKYLMQCLLHLKDNSNICDYIDFIASSEKLNAEKLDDLQAAFNVLNIDKDKAAAGTSLLWHIKKITSALAVSLEMGIPLALEELRSLSDKSNNLDGFSKALELGLPCHEIKEMCEKYTIVMDDSLWEQDEIMSTVHFLIHKITDLRDKQAKNKSAIVLVLVKQRATAVRLSAMMQKSNTMRQHNLSCVYLIGHGAGTSTGMNVNDQKKTLEEIKNNQHQVIIATSVAEEGIDLPECSLVITMKPPTSITTLVQMRGRARKKNSLFMTICGNEKQKLKLENLLKQEEVMEAATRSLVNYYRDT